jgi:hypothetical protein
MKTKLFTLSMLFTLGACNLFAQNAPVKQFITFKGTADTAYNGKQLVLYNKSTQDHDSVTVVNGQYEISVAYKEPSRYMFYSKYELKQKGGYAPFGKYGGS